MIMAFKRYLEINDFTLIDCIALENSTYQISYYDNKSKAIKTKLVPKYKKSYTLRYVNRNEVFYVDFSPMTSKEAKIIKNNSLFYPNRTIDIVPYGFYLEWKNGQLL